MLVRYRCAHCLTLLDEVDGVITPCALHPIGQIERLEVDE